MKDTSLYEFVGSNGNFRVSQADKTHNLYFPLANELGLLSAITPDLHGDIKLDQHTFLTIPVSSEDLHLSKSARNFWVQIQDGKKMIPWAINGNSPEQQAQNYGEETVTVEAGFLWHQMTRVNKKIGIEATVLSFVPSHVGTFEVMSVQIQNTSKSKLTLTCTSAIPLYARSADNLRDHRHVSSLLCRIRASHYGLVLIPTMSFNEEGHNYNRTSYYVVGVDAHGNNPVGYFPTIAGFIGEGRDLGKPETIYQSKKPQTEINDLDQGKEAMGALQFPSLTLNPGEQTSFNLFLGIDRGGGDGDKVAKTYGQKNAIDKLLSNTQKDWEEKNRRIQFTTGDPVFNQWVKWVVAQPTFRKIFGNSFLPDFDYGRGGRGWRDLWQDCLALLLAHPKEVRHMIVNNFAGVRFDGSNATIIHRKPVQTKGEPSWEPEFVADRNNLTRVWMDHGTWPFLTTQLYINQTGDWPILLEKAPYFRDAQIHRGKKLDTDWLRGEKGENPYQGTLLEHILVQHVVQFFNVGEHNMIRLEDADWNDGLDMAPDRGESVAFSNLYAGNLSEIADLIETAATKNQWNDVQVAEELLLLLDRAGQKVDYESVDAKVGRLEEYYKAVEKGVKGTLAAISISKIVSDLREKSIWLKNKINQQEWIDQGHLGWFNGYYNNDGERVEGSGINGTPRITLTGQVYPIMSDIADPEKIQKIVRAVNEYLWDHDLGGIRLNSNFQQIQPNLGRAFGFAYGEKENGAVFSHMVVMYANALYRRGFVEEGYRALNSLFTLSKNSKRSRILPGIPEYFNNEGRGRYHFLTGSASWYVYTLLTEVFGVSGNGGDLVLSPKMVPEQFNAQGKAEVEFSFAESRIKLTYVNSIKQPYENYKISQVYDGQAEMPVTRLSEKQVLIHRELLATKPQWNIGVQLEAK